MTRVTMLMCIGLTALLSMSHVPKEIGIDPALIDVSSVMETNFVAIGDTGYVADDSGISIVANAVNSLCKIEVCQFALMAGDNIYEKGATGDATDVKLFDSRFVQPYGALSDLDPDFRIYTALGNHDWYSSRVGALAQVAFHQKNPPFFMDGIFYKVKPPSLNGDLEIFVIDTEMLLSVERLPQYRRGLLGRYTGSRAIDHEAGDRPGGSPNALPQSKMERNQLQWLSTALKESNAKWKIVLAHHPLWQSRPDSKYTQSLKLRDLLMPTLCRYADAYIAGHQHTLELHTDDCGTPSYPPLVHVVNGSGAKIRPLNNNFRKWQLRMFPQVTEHYAIGDIWGFSHFTVSDDFLKVSLVSVDRNGQQNIEYQRAFRSRK